jgi:hypothetical protein
MNKQELTNKIQDIILNWIWFNYGENEKDEPSYDITSLSEELAKELERICTND